MKSERWMWKVSKRDFFPPIVTPLGEGKYRIKSIYPPSLFSVLGKRFIACSRMLECPDDLTELSQMEWEPYHRRTENPVERERDILIESSDGKKKYTVVVTKKTATCTCTGFSFRGKCRHVQVALEKIVKENESTSTDTEHTERTDSGDPGGREQHGNQHIRELHQEVDDKL